MMVSFLKIFLACVQGRGGGSGNFMGRGGNFGGGGGNFGRGGNFGGRGKMLLYFSERVYLKFISKLNIHLIHTFF